MLCLFVELKAIINTYVELWAPYTSTVSELVLIRSIQLVYLPCMDMYVFYATFLLGIFILFNSKQEEYNDCICLGT